MIIKCIYDDRVNTLLSDSIKEFLNIKEAKTSRLNIELNPYNMM
jgi:hypothetical protein